MVYGASSPCLYYSLKETRGVCGGAMTPTQGKATQGTRRIIPFSSFFSFSLIDAVLALAP